MPDLSLKLPNLTAEMSWSWRIRDSIDDGGICGEDDDDIIIVNLLQRVFVFVFVAAWECSDM